MQSQEINLSGKKGVTLDVLFNAQPSVNPFLIFITDLADSIMYYYRTIDKNRVTINLPEHSEKIKFYWAGKFPVKQILTMPLQIIPIKYEFKKDIIQKRPYKFEEVYEMTVPVINEMKNIAGHQVLVATDQPARFLPMLPGLGKGVIQYSEKVMRNLPQPLRQFIRYHELGHYYYGRDLPPRALWQHFSPEEQDKFKKIMTEDEEEADRFALYKFINEGYNFSGALYSLTDFLSPNYVSKSRIERMFQTISGIHKNQLQ